MRASSALDEHRDALAAALDVEHGLGAGEDDVGARHALRAARLVVALGPRQRRAVGLRRIGGGQHDRRRLLVGALRAQALDGAGQGELRAAEALDEVAAPAHAERLELAEGVVEDREAAGDPLGQHLLAGDDAVALEQQLGQRAPAGARLDLARGRARVVSDQRPWTCACEPVRREPKRRPGLVRSRARWARASVRRGARSGAHASLVTSPAHTRSHSASWICSGEIDSSASRSVKKHGAWARRSRSRSCSGVSGRSDLLGGGPMASTSSRK